MAGQRPSAAAVSHDVRSAIAALLFVTARDTPEIRYGMNWRLFVFTWPRVDRLSAATSS